MGLSAKFFGTRAAIAFALALVSIFSAAQDAKTLFKQSMEEGNSCKKMQLACQAAKLDSKKEYTDACDRYRSAVNGGDEKMRQRINDLLLTGDFKKATIFSGAGYVCSADLRQSLQTQIAEAQKAAGPSSTPSTPTPTPAPKADQSGALLAEANQAFDAGRFDAAVSAAQQVTDANLKPIAQGIVGKVNAYRSAVAAARQSESSKDYGAAIGSWRTAQGINSNGPDSPAANIARLEPLLHPAAPTPAAPSQAPVQVARNQPPPSIPKPNAPPPDVNAQVAKLLDDAGKAESANNLQAALHGYEAVLHLQPNNPVAQQNKTALLAKINSDPAEQAKSLAQAIRDFYSSKYTDAEDALRSYLDAPTAKSRGAANFYLGATRLYEKILSASGQKPDTAIASAEVQRPFKEARAAGYQPVERFVSPVVMRAWHNAQ